MFLRNQASALAAIFDSIGPGSISETWMPEPGSSDAHAQHQPFQRVLGGGIGAATFDRRQAEDRRAVDDAAMALRAHDRDDAPGQIVPAEEIGLELLAQRVDRQVLDRAGLGIAAIVEERVEPAAGALPARRRPALAIESGSR